MYSLSFWEIESYHVACDRCDSKKPITLVQMRVRARARRIVIGIFTFRICLIGGATSQLGLSFILIVWYEQGFFNKMVVYQPEEVACFLRNVACFLRNVACFLKKVPCFLRNVACFLSNVACFREPLLRCSAISVYIQQKWWGMRLKMWLSLRA